MDTLTATRLRKLVAEHMNVDPAIIGPDSAFVDDLGGDSWDAIELSIAVEEEWGFEITDDEAEDAFGRDGTFAKACALVDAKLAGKVAETGRPLFVRTKTLPACEHDFGGWREHSDGLGGEQFCQKCGLGAMAHTMAFLP